MAGGFTYFMDERDEEWLDKNNEDACGEDKRKVLSPLLLWSPLPASHLCGVQR